MVLQRPPSSKHSKGKIINKQHVQQLCFRLVIELERSWGNNSDTNRRGLIRVWTNASHKFKGRVERFAVGVARWGHFETSGGANVIKPAIPTMS